MDDTQWSPCGGHTSRTAIMLLALPIAVLLYQRARSSPTSQQVQQQAETVVRIDENVDETLANVDAAQTYLLKYLKNISSNRWLMMKVFFVLMVFMIFFMVFVV